MTTNYNEVLKERDEAQAKVADLIRWQETVRSASELVRQRDALLAVVKAYEAAREGLFAQCCSNPVKDAWGRNVDMALLNEAHEQAGRVLRNIGT